MSDQGEQRQDVDIDESNNQEEEKSTEQPQQQESFPQQEQFHQVSMPDDGFQIEILVSDPTTKNTQFSKHTLYTIKGKDNIGAFEVQRRYNDFSSLRDVLILKWPGCFVPNLPGRKTFAGTDTKVVGDRLKFLNAFCGKLAKLPHLFYCTEVNNVFLRSKDQDVYKVLQQIQKPNTVELIQRYQIHFGQLQGRDIDQNLVQKINAYTTHVKKSRETLKKYKQFVRETVENQDKLNKTMEDAFMLYLPEYERNCLKTYCGNNEDMLLFANPRFQAEFQEKYKIKDIFKYNNLQLFLDLLRLELKDCKAYLQIIKTKDEYEALKVKLEQKSKDLQIEYQNALQGKTSLKNIFKKGTNEDLKSSIQAQIQENNNELENLKVLFDIMTAIIGFIEIEALKKEKSDNYTSIMSTIADLELQVVEQQLQFWQFLEDQSELLLQQSVA